jgi:hypothetical protein
MSQNNKPVPPFNPEKIVRVLTQGSQPKESTIKFKTITEVNYYLTTVDRHAATITQKVLSDKQKSEVIFALLQKTELPYSIVAMAQMLIHLPVAPELKTKIIQPGYPPVETNETFESRYKENLRQYI